MGCYRGARALHDVEPTALGGHGAGGILLLMYDERR